MGRPGWGKRSDTFPFIVRFLAYLDVGEPDECWEWQGARLPDGYGELRNPETRRPERAHRVAYRAFKGPIPRGRMICHTCDNPPCCNPRHLYAGSAKDNSDDAHGRISHGWVGLVHALYGKHVKVVDDREVLALHGAAFVARLLKGQHA